ncbi:MAG: DNA polymerase [Pirellulales bacterium]
MSDALRHFDSVWCVDCEYGCGPGERPEVRCLVAVEYRTGRELRLWADELAGMPAPPFDVGESSLVTSYYAPAELSSFLSLGWKLPQRILDQYVEFRAITNGLELPTGSSLLGALAYFGLPALDGLEKTELRKLALRGGDYTDDERKALLDYCAEDVHALVRLLPLMLPKIDLPRAIYRGRYQAAVARMEHAGTPCDRELLERLREAWEPIKARLIREIEGDYAGVFVPVAAKFDRDSTVGRAVVDVADESGIDPHLLYLAVSDLWEEQRQAQRSERQARSTARQRSGLTVNRIAAWEESGRDYSSWPALDVTARTIAGDLPELGIGRGYSSDHEDEGDQAGRLWELMREPERRFVRRDDPELLSRAAELVRNAGPNAYSGPYGFSTAGFSAWLSRVDIPWPRLETGALDLSDECFRQMARRFPELVGPLRELRFSLSQMRLSDLAVGLDGRNRAMLSPFRSITGRNQPSNSKFVFGPSAWIRSLIQPEPGQAVAYLDYSGQEIAVAAALSGDTDMQAAYESGDPYLWLAKAGDYAPADATKATHGDIRDTFKIVYLAANYGMQANSLSQLLGQPEAYAKQLLALHRRKFPRFWKWSDSTLDAAMLHGKLWTCFGWPLHVRTGTKPNTIRNFLVQGSGAEIMRLAACLLTEAGIEVHCPVHDAFLIGGPTGDMPAIVEQARELMIEAGRVVLNGYPIRVDSKVVNHPERYSDKRGERMWGVVMGILEELATTSSWATHGPTDSF